MDIKNQLTKAKKYLHNPDYRFLIKATQGKCDCMKDKEYLEKMFKARLGRVLDLNNPKSYNEKMQWLKLYDRKPEYTVYVDKYKVRDYVKEKIGEKYLIPLLGVWDDPDEIDFNSLPNQFVLKCNHNSGLGMCLCKDKSLLNLEKVRRELRKGINQDYYLTGREWPYKDVSRKIIAEKYMIDNENTELDDYKFYCFDGKVKMLGVYSDRNSSRPTKVSYLDRNLNEINIRWGYQRAPIPNINLKVFEKMVSIAECLSEKIPSLRVDLYLCNGKIYFGELTFFDGSGFDKIDPIEWDYKMGEWIHLPSDV